MASTAEIRRQRIAREKESDRRKESAKKAPGDKKSRARWKGGKAWGR